MDIFLNSLVFNIFPSTSFLPKMVFPPLTAISTFKRFSLTKESCLRNQSTVYLPLYNVMYGPKVK